MLSILHNNYLKLRDDLISSILSKLERQDPTAFPDPASEVASFIIINEGDIDDLKDPLCPDILIQHIIPDNRRDREEKYKRKRDDFLKPSLDESEALKCRCIDGDRAVEWMSIFEFSEIMYTTDSHTALPLPFFQNKNLGHIIDHVATLSTIKSNSREGELFTLDVTLLFDAKMAIDFGQWHEAAATWFFPMPGNILNLDFSESAGPSLPSTTPPPILRLPVRTMQIRIQNRERGARYAHTKPYRDFSATIARRSPLPNGTV